MSTKRKRHDDDEDEPIAHLVLDQIIEEMAKSEKEVKKKIVDAKKSGIPASIPSTQNNRDKSRFMGLLAFNLIIDTYRQSMESKKKREQGESGKLDTSHKKDPEDIYRSTKVSRRAKKQ